MYHLSVNRAGDFDSSVFQSRSGFGSPPSVVIADMLGLREEVEQDSSIKLLLSQLSSFQKLFPCGVEGPMQRCKELDCLVCEDGFSVVRHRSEDFDAGDR